MEKKRNNALMLYHMAFGEFPPQLMELSYDDEDYKDLMLKAVARNSPITNEDLEKIIKYEEVTEDGLKVKNIY